MKLFRWIANLLGRKEPDEQQDGEPSRSQEARAPKRSDLPRYVTVGVDFGTSSTKVVFRDWNTKNQVPYAVDFGVDLPGYTRFSRPSLIAVQDGLLLFGQRAAEAANEEAPAAVIRSAKVQLLEKSVDEASPTISWELPLRMTDWGESTAERRVSVLEGLVALFLADTIRIALEATRQVYADLSPSEVAFNLDVPVGGLDASPVAHRFQRMLDVAIPMASQVEAEMAVEEALDLWWGTFCRLAENPPEPGERPGELVPEAEAIIQGVGSALGGRSSDLYHAIVDIGAGTTDVGWFKVVETRSEDRLPFFAARTRRVGCNDIDECLAEQLAETTSAPPELIVSQIIAVKPDLICGEQTAVEVEGRRLTVGPEALERATEEVAPAVYGHFSKMFGPAYSKEKNTDRWERIRTVVVGGGSLLPKLRNRFGEHPRDFGKEAELVDLSTEMDLRAVGESDTKPTRKEKPFLTAALGLSHPKYIMPTPIMPSEIDDDPGAPSGQTGLYDYEINY